MNAHEMERLAELFSSLSQKYGFRPAMVEKDYYLTMILNGINRAADGKIVFKGGTLLNKVYLDYHRMSEDLDFSYNFGAVLPPRTARSKAADVVRKVLPEYIESLGLELEDPLGKGFNNSTQYVFNVLYGSGISGKNERIKLEISMRAPIYDVPVLCKLKHIFKDIFTGKELLPQNDVLALSYEEAVAEKTKAVATRRTPAIRDFFDLSRLAKKGFDFKGKRFRELLAQKLADENYEGDFSVNLGLPDDSIVLLRKQVQTELRPVIRENDKFDLDEVLENFNEIFSS